MVERTKKTLPPRWLVVASVNKAGWPTPSDERGLLKLGFDQWNSYNVLGGELYFFQATLRGRTLQLPPHLSGPARTVLT